jgi:hypothetical protein
MFVGLIGLTYGLAIKSNLIIKTGLIAFLSGLILCGIGNAVPLGSGFVATLKEYGFRSFIKDLCEEPRPWVFFLGFFLIYSFLAIMGVVMILAAAVSTFR